MPVSPRLNAFQTAPRRPDRAVPAFLFPGRSPGQRNAYGHCPALYSRLRPAAMSFLRHGTSTPPETGAMRGRMHTGEGRGRMTMLEATGLAEAEERVYRILVEVPSASAEDVSARSGLSPREA